ncbi:MAG: ParA family protein [Verrucomicrobiota bacterium]
MKIVALSIQKGGVGKTTTAVNLGACVALAGKRVLILDLDPQANATSHLGVEPDANPSIYRALSGEKTVADLVIDTKYQNLSIIPAEKDLAGAEVELAKLDNHMTWLRDLLHGFRETAQYDFLLIDCPPSLGILMTSALAAADEILVPLQCEYFGLEGLAQVVEVTERIRESGVNPTLRIEGIVLTMADSRTNLTDAVINDVRNTFEETAYETVIPRSVRLSEAPSFKKTINDYAPQSKGALAYVALSMEFLKRHKEAEAQASAAPFAEAAPSSDAPSIAEAAPSSEAAPAAEATPATDDATASTEPSPRSESMPST